MALTSNVSQATSSGIDYSIKDVNGLTKQYQVTSQTHWPESISARRGELFNVGGGDLYKTYPVNNFGFGSYVLTPKQNFTGIVHMWAGGGGAWHDSGSRFAGGGGYSQAIVRFLADTPYTIVVGGAGAHTGGIVAFSDVATHGGGGRGHNQGGAGGGLSGIFMNTDHFGTASWAHGTPPVTQANALMVAGGGGGGGHHTQSSHYGNSGGGGGWVGKRAHNGSGGTQTAGGAAGYSNAIAGSALHGGHSGSNTSWLGGGGGGWYGGGGGGHSGSHHDGGNGGSGHIAYPAAVGIQPNNDKSGFIVQGFLEKAPGHFNFSENRPANFTNPLNLCEGRHAGQGGIGEQASSHGPTYGPRHGKVVITLLPDFFGKYNFPTHASPHDSTNWTQSY